MSPSPPARRRSLLALAVTFLALGGAILAAHFSPATGYEVNIFDATPLTFWVPLGVALVASTYVSITARSTWAWVGGLAGSAGSVLAVAALPLFRSYYFFGPADSMTHLGWVKDILTGRLPTAELLYPGIHTFTIFLSHATGARLTRAMLFVSFSFMVLYVLFVPITVWLLTDRRWLITAGAYAGMMFLTVNQISVHYMAPHPFSQITHVLPVSVYVFALYLVSRPGDAAVGERRVTAIGALFALVSIGVVLYHPLYAVALLVVLGLALVIQLVARRVTFSHRIIEHRSLLPQVGFFGVLTLVWVQTHPRGGGNAEIILSQVQAALLGTAGVGGIVQQRSGSLSDIGASTGELFVKIFLVMAIFAALTGILILLAGTRRLNADRSDTSAVVVYLSLGLAFLVPASFVLFVGNSSRLFFRNVGTIMALSTILGVLALAYIPAVAERSRRLRPLVRRVRGFGSRLGRARAAIAVVVVLMLMTHSLALMFTSPYIYRPTRSVSEPMMSGYQSTFDHQVEGVEIAGLRGGPSRYLEAIYGPARVGGTYSMGRDDVDDLETLQASLNGTWYVTISDYARLREVVAYRELRFDQEGFDSLDSQIGVNRVLDNGEVQTYYLT